MTSLRLVAVLPHLKLDLAARNRISLPLPTLLLLAASLLVLLGCTPGRFSATSNGWSPASGSDGSVYVGSKQGNVRALVDDGFDGFQTSWTFPANQDGDSDDRDSLFGVYGSPVVGEDLVYVSGIDGVLYAIDRKTGTIGSTGWKQPRGQVEDERPPLVGEPALDPASNVVVVGSEDGKLYAFDAKTGDPREGFPFTAEDKIWSTPVIQDGVIYFGSHDKHIYAVSLTDGTLKWKFLTGGVVAGRPLIFRDMVIAGSFDKNLYAINIKDGSKSWEFPGENWFWAGAVSNGRTIFAPSMDGNVYALDRAGNVTWKHDVGSPIISRPVLIPAGLVVAGKDSKITLLDTSLAEVGLQRVRSVRPLPDDPEILAPLYAVGESILVGAQDNTVRRIEIRASQAPMWCFDTESENGRCN